MNFLRFLVLLLIPSVLHAQTERELKSEGGSTYRDFDITSLVKTEYDFNQTKLSSTQIDDSIKSIIVKQANTPLSQLQVPLNTKKLFYHGKIHPVLTNLFYSERSYFKEHDTILNKDAHIYSYGRTFVSSSTNMVVDKYLAYYVFRAMAIIEARFPLIYKKLIDEVDEIPLKKIAKVTPAYINMTKQLFITFDGVLPQVSNNAYLGPLRVAYDPPIKDIELYYNTQVIYFNKSSIWRGGASGNVPIYKEADFGPEALFTYLKDGLIHSIVHERLHDFIFQNKNLIPKFDFIRQRCQTDQLVSNYYTLEEAIVNNTTNALFELEKNNGGLSNDILNFYKKEFELSISKFKAEKTYEKLVLALEEYFEKDTPIRWGKVPLMSTKNDRTIFFIDLMSE